MSDEQRRLAAVMFTDMVGYTALGQRNESLSLALAEEQRRMIRPVLLRHNGREVKTIGDAFLVEFPSALDAVRCAYDIQRAARELNFSLPEDSRIHLRVGIHLGDVVESRGDISGDTVNVASRIEPLADDGGVCFTRQVYDHVSNKFDLPIASIGLKALKNVSAPLEVYKLVMPWSEERPTQATRPDKNRIAVLPFTNISPDPADEYFADGMTEELITRLSEVKGMRVIARTSVMNYKNKEKKISDIGRELGAGSIIEGSVRKAGNRIRITVQLIDAGSEEHVWASNYDRELDDVFAIQSDVAQRVAGSVTAGIYKASERKDTEDMEAYTLYLKALQLYHLGSESALRESASLLEKSISKDPAFARAHATLALVWGTIASGGYEDFIVVQEKAEPEAKTALELDPNLAEAHSAMAAVHSWLDRFQDVLAESSIAISLNPNLSSAYFSQAMEYCSDGNLESGLASFEKAYEVDPLSYRAGRYIALVAQTMGNMDKARDMLDRLLELNPENPMSYVGLAEWYLVQRDFTGAQEMLDRGRKASPNEPLVDLNQGVLYALTGRKEDAERVLEEGSGRVESVDLYGRLFINAALGRLDEAFKALFRMEEKHSWPMLIKTLPVFEGLRKDPRFSQFCTRVGLHPP